MNQKINENYHNLIYHGTYLTLEKLIDFCGVIQSIEGSLSESNRSEYNAKPSLEQLKSYKIKKSMLQYLNVDYLRVSYVNTFAEMEAKLEKIIQEVLAYFERIDHIQFISQLFMKMKEEIIDQIRQFYELISKLCSEEEYNSIILYSIEQVNHKLDQFFQIHQLNI